MSYTIEQLQNMADSLDVTLDFSREDVIFIEYGIGGAVCFQTIDDAMNALILLDEY